ncbi:hypothetical protein LINPERPRIM_LOCUS16941 [Linum perenne]
MEIPEITWRRSTIRKVSIDAVASSKKRCELK